MILRHLADGQGLEVLDDEKYTANHTDHNRDCRKYYHRACVDHSLMNECENGAQ